MIFVGIDPGLSGAIARIQSGSVEIYDIPTLQVAKTRREVDAKELVSLLRTMRAKLQWESLGATPSSWALTDAEPRIIVGLEKVHSMRGQGVASTFAFGRVYGTLIGALSALALPYELTTPQAWHKTMLAGMPKGKDSSIQRCHELFPEVHCITKKAHHNRADALLIAEHMRRIAGGVSE